MTEVQSIGLFRTATESARCADMPLTLAETSRRADVACGAIWSQQMATLRRSNIGNTAWHSARHYDAQQYAIILPSIALL